MATERLVRAKGILDGAKSIDEAVMQAHGFVTYLEQLRTKGWVIEEGEEVAEDHMHLVNKGRG